MHLASTLFVFRIKDWSIRNKLAAIALASAAPILIALFAYELPAIEERMHAERRTKTRHLVETAHSVVAAYGAQAEHGLLSVEAAQAEAKRVVEQMRYDDAQYFWINDLESRMIVHPYEIEKVGQDLSAHKDPEGTYLFREIVAIVQEQGEGELVYMWPKPDGSEPVRKVSYVKLYEPWGWVIGTGIYVDDIESTSATNGRWLFGVIAIAMLLASGIIWVIARYISEPLNMLEQTSQRVADGDYSASVSVHSRDEIGSVAKSFNQMMARVSAAREDLRKEARKAEEAVQQSEHTSAFLSQRVDEVLYVMGRFAEGDLTVRLTPEENRPAVEASLKARRAIEALYGGVNQAICNVREMLREVSAAADLVTDEADQIANTTEMLAAGSQQQAAHAEEVATTVEHVLGTSVKNSEHATHAADIVQRAAQAARNGGEVIEQTVQKIEAVAEGVYQSAHTINALQRQGKHIDDVIKTIGDIAHHTTLLSLNATIEAARAGEHGRGFGVVAAEVRELAERTSRAALEVTEIIESIQDEVQVAADSVERGQQAAASGIKLSDQTGEAFAEIVFNAEETVQVIEALAMTTDEQAAASRQIASVVQGMASVSSQSATGSVQIAQSAAGLKRRAQDLHAYLSRFKVEQELEVHTGDGASVSDPYDLHGDADVSDNLDGDVSIWD